MYVDAFDLTPNPESVTDWGHVLNANAADGLNVCFTDHGLAGGRDYDISTPINFDGRGQMGLFGANGRVHPGDGQDQKEPRARLVWKGDGDGPAINLASTGGFVISGLGLYYDNPLYTGRLITGGVGVQGPASRILIEKSAIGSRRLRLWSAECLVSLDNTINSCISDCTLVGAKYGAKGTEHFWSNTNRVMLCLFANQRLAHVCNVGIDWTLGFNTYEMSSLLGETPTVIGCDMPIGSQFTVLGGSVWDYATDNDPDKPDEWKVPFDQDARNVWQATFANLSIFLRNAPAFRLRAGGSVNIVHNNEMQRSDYGPLIDLGDVSKGAAPLGSVNVHGNRGVCYVESVLNRAGHSNVNVHGNSTSFHAAEVRTLGGYERLGYQNGIPGPTVTPGPGLGAGGLAYMVRGGDAAGQIVLEPGADPLAPPAAGVVAVIRFGTRMDSERQTPQSPLLFLTPTVYGSGTRARLFQSASEWGPDAVAIESDAPLAESMSLNFQVKQV